MKTETICKICGIKIVDTSWRPQKVYDTCTECEGKALATATVESETKPRVDFVIDADLNLPGLVNVGVLD